MCSTSSKVYLCDAEFGSAIALDIQQKLKTFLHSSNEQMAMRSLPGISSSFT